jgi:hypothetical protein
MVVEFVTLQDGTELRGIPRDLEIFRTATALLQKVFSDSAWTALCSVVPCFEPFHLSLLPVHPTLHCDGSHPLERHACGCGVCIGARLRRYQSSRVSRCDLALPNIRVFFCGIFPGQGASDEKSMSLGGQQTGEKN